MVQIGQHGRDAAGPSRDQMRTKYDSDYSSNVDDIAIWASPVAARVPGCGLLAAARDALCVVAIANPTACCAYSLLYLKLRHQHGTLRVPV